MTQLRYFWENYYYFLVCSLVCLDYFICWWWVHSYFNHIIDQQNVGIHFLMTHGFPKQFFYCFTWSSNQFLILNAFSFLFQTLLLIISVSLCVCPRIFCHRLATPYLTCFRISDCFLLWMLATEHNPCHVPHVPRTTTCGIISKTIVF